MRLTNVAHLRLPFGRLVGYDLQVGDPGAPLPVSFDQRRHVGAGDRAGSWMALSFRLTGQRELSDLAEAWRAVVQRHGTLRTVFVPDASTGTDDAGPGLHEVEIGEGRWVEHPIPAGQPVNEARREPFADRPPVPAFAEHTEALRDRPRAPEDVRRRWAEVLGASGQVMPRFPMPLGESDGPQPERVEVRDVLDVDDSGAFGVRAKELGVSTLSLVVAAMTEVTREVADQPLRAVFPVHSRYDATWHDSVGWFITNSVLESPDPDPTACAEAVKEAVRLGSWPLEDVLEPWGGMPEAPGMFAISWLDLRRLPVRVDSVGLEAQYLGASILTDGVMLWFVLDESGLHLRCRYPDTPPARAGVGRWLDRLVERLREEAAEQVGGVLDVGGWRFRLQRARRTDVPAVVALLADDPISGAREVDDVVRYEAAYDAVARDPGEFLAVVRDHAGTVVATMQLSIIPGLSRAGATRLEVEGVRVARGLRGLGLGAAMLEWAHDHGRARGATLAQLTTDSARADAHRFYERLGYTASHKGFKRPL